MQPQTDQWKSALHQSLKRYHYLKELLCTPNNLQGNNTLDEYMWKQRKIFNVRIFPYGRASAGASISPWDHDAFPPCFRFPPYFRNFTLHFPKNFLIFIRRNFWWPFFSHRPEISNFPLLFSPFQYISPCFAKIIIPPTFTNFPSCFRQIHLLFTCFTCISFPPTLTMMHGQSREGNPMHVLDAPGPV